MKAGIMLLQDVPWGVLRERAVRAESMGFETIWVADHLVEPYNPTAPWSEAWTLLGALGALTTSARLGALTSSQTLRNPTLLVQAARTLSSITGGRAELALGAGGAPLDHAMTGVPAWSPAERAARFGEFVPIVASILRTGAVADAPAGSHFPVTNVELGEGDAIRLTVAGLGPKSIALAAQYGDAWNSYGVPAGKRLTTMLTHEEGLALFRTRKARFDRACGAAGRDPGSIDRSYTWVESYVQPVLGDLDACRSVVSDFAQAGVSEFVIYWPKEAHLEEGLEKFAEIVLSA